jgi:hypothetical protein
MAYFAWLDDQTWPRGHKAATFGSLKQITVPTEWPLDFDASAPPAPLPEPPLPPVPLERRKQLGAMLRGLGADLELREQRAPTWRNMTPEQAAKKLDEIAEDYARTPPAVNTREMNDYLAGIHDLSSPEKWSDGEIDS